MHQDRSKVQENVFDPEHHIQSRKGIGILKSKFEAVTDRPTLPANATLQPPPKSIVLLTTPHYASFLTDDSGVLQSHISTLLTPAKADPATGSKPANDSAQDNNAEIEVLAAVVDDLPYLGGLARGAILPPAQRTKGYSWLITDHSGIISPLGPTENVAEKKPSAGRMSNWGMEKPAPLVFVFPTAEGEAPKSVTLPLANTLFQTGRFATFAKFSVSAKDKKSPRPIELRERPGYRVTIPAEAGAAASQAHFTSKLPLVPLTPPRQVMACAGNILRAVEGESATEGKGGVPASRELEKAVDSYFSRGERSPGKVDIFACITPTEPPAGITPGRRDREHPNPWALSLPSTLNPSPTTNLRRVLSGGGGWGNKVGLLSLDPQGWSYALNNGDYDMLHYSDDLTGDEGGGSSGDESADGGEFKRAFENAFFGKNDDISDVREAEPENGNTVRGKGAVVQVGDYVQFFIVEHKTPAIPAELHDGEKAKSFSFGCVGKEGELIGHGWDAADITPVTTLLKESLIMDGVFGARSEEGVWIHSEGDGEQAGVRAGRGKMDVPGGEIGVELP
ncbi:hypothetical protein DFH27DRAFT_528141 [Peziza echinospora]|nr:hypothetical protein DFH27DRAFT_528141 [Peziza echinospora]